MLTYRAVIFLSCKKTVRDHKIFFFLLYQRLSGCGSIVLNVSFFFLQKKFLKRVLVVLNDAERNVSALANSLSQSVMVFSLG